MFFEKFHEDFMMDSLEGFINNTIEEKIDLLKTEYEKNYYISEANVRKDGENVKVELKLTFDPVDAEEQSIVEVFEYGGVIKRAEDDFVEIEPNRYINRIFGN